MAQADIGLIGLAVMGENLILNMESKGFTVACFNRTVSKVDDFVNGRAGGKNIIGCHSIEELAANLKKPRKVMLMVKAGQAVDAFIDKVLPHLEDGDIIIDGGNSHFPDTIRRTEYVESKGKLYIGTGVSGGEEGALRGPSIMPGGSPPAWEHVKPIFQKIAAKTDDGEPCCDWVGENGAGHFVKMVHNGIEYGDMQMICETYQIMREGLGMTNQQMHEVFAEWNQGELNSYLIEITRDILGYKDEDGNEVIDLILDTAGRLHTQKDLMKELTKIRDVVSKKIMGGPHEVLLVLDSTTGQNAIAQAKMFTEAIDVTGIFLAKLDGTARGGIVIAIKDQLDIPVKFVGLGEKPEDIAEFGIEGNFTLTGGNLTLNQGYNPNDWIDLGGDWTITDGTFTINGGSTSSYWPYLDGSSLNMSGGILDITDNGIYVYDGGFVFNENITGGTIRTTGSFDIIRADYNPIGGTVEL